MSYLPALILLASAAAGTIGIFWLATGKPPNIALRRLTLGGLLILPIAAYTLLMISIPSGQGGFWPWYAVGLMMLGLPMLGWAAMCGGAYWLGGRKR